MDSDKKQATMPIAWVRLKHRAGVAVDNCEMDMVNRSSEFPERCGTLRVMLMRWKREELVVAPSCKLGGNAATVDFFDWSMIWCFHPSQST